MEDQLSEEFKFRQESKNFDSKAKKFLTILATSVLLLIPSIIYEAVAFLSLKAYRKHKARHNKNKR